VKDFRRLWLATSVSQLGTQVSELAIPLQFGLLAAAGVLASWLGLHARLWVGAGGALLAPIVLLPSGLRRVSVTAAD